MNLRLGVAIASVCFVWSACGHKAAAVVIVGKDQNARVMGEVSFVNEGGNFHADIWKTGNVVIFRTDGTLDGRLGKAAKAYRIDKEKWLVEIEAVDLAKSDEQLAERYGIKAK